MKWTEQEQAGSVAPEIKPLYARNFFKRACF